MPRLLNILYETMSNFAKGEMQLPKSEPEGRALIGNVTFVGGPVWA